MLDFKNCTFIIPLKIDNSDRIYNIKTILRYLDTFTQTNICIMEQNKFKTELDLNFKNLNITHHNIYYDKFYKTKLLNNAVKYSNTEILIPYDSDVLVPINQIEQAVNLIKENKIDYCFPFNKYYVEISKRIMKERKEVLLNFNFETYFNKLVNHRTSIGKIKDINVLIRNTPPGGCIVIKRQVYIDFGLENEEFYGYAAEDQERKIRLKKMNYRTQSIEGNIYHIEHEVAYKRTPDINNKKLWESLEKMNCENLKKYYKEKNYKEKYNL